MISIQGKGVSSGVAMGPLYHYRRGLETFDCYKVEDPQEEIARFETAQKVAIEQLGELSEKARTDVGDSAASLFEAHKLMIEDPEYVDTIKKMILDSSMNAEAAVEDTESQFVEMFSAMNDEYMQARAMDVNDISTRIIGILQNARQNSIESDVPVILVADDLTPSETIQFDKDKILGFITEGGSTLSHTAILARTLGIPAIIGVGDVFKPEYDGKTIYIDGDTGKAVIDADELTIEQIKDKMEKQKKRHELMDTYKGVETCTKDGQKIDIYCNIGSVEDVEAVIANDGEGIGLFRSEFLYLKNKDYPSEEMQFEAYRAVAMQMKGKRVIIRTLDIGADKQVDYFDLQHEENPAMGMRAIRICLTRPEIFHTQLRALYRASAYGKIAILFPMITALWEIKECKKACIAVQEELKSENIPYNADTELGIMIETPAAVMMSDVFSKEVDFFSVGTNDLTQYTLACDRQSNTLGKFFDPHHPAVLRMVSYAAKKAHENGIWIGICGELGADSELLGSFLAMNIDELSVSPTKVLPLRESICQMDDPEERKQQLEKLLQGI